MLKVAQARIFRADELSPNLFRTDSAIQKIRTEFAFKQFAIVPPPLTPDQQGGVAFASGEFKVAAATYALESLVIESRRILMTIIGPSEIGNASFARLRDIAREIDQRLDKPDLVPLVLTEETTTVVQLDHPITRLATNGPLGKLLKGLPERTEGYGAKPRILPVAFQMRVTYDDLPTYLKDSNIALADSTISIELRAGTALGDNFYFVVSPNPSPKHLELIALLEKALEG